MINKIYNEDCVQGIKRIPSNSIDAILTDPPYLYLKNQKLDKEFDEDTLFKEWVRVLKDDGMLAIFGRGVPCARWIVKLDELGFKHKEDMVWNKSYCSSPLLPISRVHENFFIFAKGEGKVIKTKVPYLQMKEGNIASIKMDIDRLCEVLRNPKSLIAVRKFLENNEVVNDGVCKDGLTNSSLINRPNKCISVVNGMKNEMNEKSIIRDDYRKDDAFMKSGIAGDNESAGTGNRCVNVAQSISNGMNEKSIINAYDYDSKDRKGNYDVVAGDGLKNGNRCVYVASNIENGMNEKSIIKEQRDHYDTIHPTQKPVSLLVRILNLISRKGDTILDCFSGSGSTAIACMKSGRDFIGFELDKEYYDKSIERIHSERDLFTF